MTIYMTARFTIRPEAAEKCQAAIQEFTEYIQVNEPGTLLYTSVQETADPTHYLHFFIFTDEAARDLHRKSEGVMRFTSKLYPELTSNGVEFKEYRLVATT
ncbi:MAG: antibiotic biosynthesis monooxygenase family protein [Chloroflexota bacterium]